ncbi:hypothetical protein PCA20602_01609 [Pandoraea capi]|uniref:Surface presentation of antigen domain-containing protein n=1 Tax=Pandoraea capi TaxID=2508286 RepID=A0ABY6VX15_9BURK|nr:hypothetical protein [Pandoraea capi]VVD90707.1 hypothetical protein PCA20602_01609 [Pandoraea capi]
MEPMIGAWMYARPVSPTEDDAQPSNDKSLEDRLDGELRRRRSDRRERDASPGGAPVGLTPIPPVPPEPTRPVAGHGKGPPEEDAHMVSTARDADDAQRAGRHRRANVDGAVRQAFAAAQIAVQRLAKTSTDGREIFAFQGVQDSVSNAATTAAVDTKDIARTPARQDVPTARDAITPAVTRPDGASALSHRPANHAGEPGRPQADVVSMPAEAAAVSNGSARRQTRRGAADGEPSGALAHASASHRPLQASAVPSSQAPPPRTPGSGAHGQAAGAAAQVPVRGDSMRYAFGSWGKGHFVNVQVVQVDGRSGFVLGASDAMVQRRLASALPASGAVGSSGASGDSDSPEKMSVRIVEALPHSDDMRDEESEC